MGAMETGWKEGSGKSLEYTQGRKETHLSWNWMPALLMPSSSTAVPGLRQPEKDSSLEGDHPSPLDSLETVHWTSMKEARFSHPRRKEESLLGPFTGDRSRELARNWREERGVAFFTRRQEGLGWKKVVRRSPVPEGKLQAAESVLEPSWALLVLAEELTVTAASLTCHDSAVPESETIRRLNCGVLLQRRKEWDEKKCMRLHRNKTQGL